MRGTHSSTLLLFVLAIFFTSSPFTNSSAFAARQYRCNGRVQYRPCEPLSRLSPPTVRYAPIRRQLAPSPLASHIPGKRYVRIIAQDLTPASKPKGARLRHGVWSGIVEGNGLIKLYLEVNRNGSVEDRRYMGAVLLKNSATTFRFVSSLPIGSNWSWNIASEAL